MINFVPTQLYFLFDLLSCHKRVFYKIWLLKHATAWFDSLDFCVDTVNVQTWLGYASLLIINRDKGMLSSCALSLFVAHPNAWLGGDRARDPPFNIDCPHISETIETHMTGFILLSSFLFQEHRIRIVFQASQELTFRLYIISLSLR